MSLNYKRYSFRGQESPSLFAEWRGTDRKLQFILQGLTEAGFKLSLGSIEKLKR